MFKFPLRFLPSFGISLKAQWMKTHLFVLWTEETIKLVFLSHLQRKRCSASRAIGSDTQSTQTEEKTHTLIRPALSFILHSAFILLEVKEKKKIETI